MDANRSIPQLMKAGLSTREGLYRACLVLALTQVFFLFLFLGIKYFPILSISKVIGRNFSAFGKLNLRRLVAHLESLSRFKEMVSDSSDEGGQVSQQEGFEEYLLDQEERAENYERLGNQAD